MGDWKDLLKSLGFGGFGIGVTVAVGWFLAYRVWPWLQKQWDENKAERKEMLADFHTALERRDKGFEGVVIAQRDTIKALEDLRDEIREKRR